MSRCSAKKIANHYEIFDSCTRTERRVFFSISSSSISKNLSNSKKTEWLRIEVHVKEKIYFLELTQFSLSRGDFLIEIYLSNQTLRLSWSLPSSDQWNEKSRNMRMLKGGSNVTFVFTANWG